MLPRSEVAWALENLHLEVFSGVFSGVGVAIERYADDSGTIAVALHVGLPHNTLETLNLTLSGRLIDWYVCYLSCAQTIEPNAVRMVCATTHFTAFTDIPRSAALPVPRFCLRLRVPD